MNKPFRYKDYKPHYFWGERPFSQWTVDKNQFIEGERVFNCCEQYMMYKKALLFDDYETAERIMDVKTPKEQKILGRVVKNFDPKIWDSRKDEIVLMGNMYKFGQNKTYKDRLMSLFNDKFYFVEASPYDKIWGIGINVSDAQAGCEWKGENLLGKALTGVAIHFTLHP